MGIKLTPDQILGRDDSHVADWFGIRLHPKAIESFKLLKEDAAKAGFDLRIVSGFRPFDRQLLIFNKKAIGERPIFDENDRVVKVANLSPYALLRSILRFSALPGASRHHWGSDIDIYDASSVSSEYVVQLSKAEVVSGGVFHELHQWLDEQIRKNEAHGFYRPYEIDYGGVAPEKWHLSFAPLAFECEVAISIDLIVAAWDNIEKGNALELRSTIDEHIEEIFNRFIRPPAR